MMEAIRIIIWLIIIIILGGVSTGIYFLLKKKVRCPGCNEIIKKHYKVCPYCKMDLTTRDK